jgi:hypothetical protein
VSRGSRKGPQRPPNQQAGAPILHVVVVRPADEAESEQQFKVRGGPAKGSPFLVLAPRDAGYLYRLAHRAPTAVLATVAVHVRPDPSKPEPDTHRNLLTLEAFVRHKAYYAVLRDLGDVARVLAASTHWAAAPPAPAEKDPRMLPLHSFCTGDPWADLAATAGQARFVNRHRAGAGWRDDCDRGWNVDPAMHGGGVLTVAGQPLPAGYHWDVINGVPGTTRLTTATEVWALEQRGAHANVYPDGYVRKGEQVRGICVRRWPK